MDGGYALEGGPPPLPDIGQDMEAGGEIAAHGGPFQEGNPQSTQCPNLSERKEAGKEKCENIFSLEPPMNARIVTR